MKKITSVAALCLRLTWVRVLGLFAAVGVAQWCAFTMSGEIANEWTSFEYLLDRFPAWIGRGGFLFLSYILIFTVAGGKGSKTGYTLRRLRVSEKTHTWIFALVFAGYIVAYHAFQICMVLLLYGYYDQIHGFGRELLFLAAFRSEYFHFLLPLYEPWAVVLNGLMTLFSGVIMASIPRELRKGRSLLGFSLMLWSWTQNTGEMASQSRDIFMIVGMAITIVCCFLWLPRRNENEAD